MITTDYPLFNNFFQLGYATSDLDQAMKALRESHRINKYKVMRNSGTNEMDMHIALAYVGDLMIELIEPCGGNDAFYRDLLLADEFTIRHHHMGYRVEDEAHWQGLRATIKKNDFTIAASGDVPGLLRFAYVDNRKQLGHYLEYILTTPAGDAAFFGDVPRN